MMDTDYKNIGTIEITQDLLTEYIGAVGANSESFRDIVPNMLVVSRSIAMMLDRFKIKDGAIHSTQEVQNLGTAKVGDVVECYALKEKTKTRIETNNLNRFKYPWNSWRSYKNNRCHEAANRKKHNRVECCFQSSKNPISKY